MKHCEENVGGHDLKLEFVSSLLIDRPYSVTELLLRVWDRNPKTHLPSEMLNDAQRDDMMGNFLLGFFSTRELVSNWYIYFPNQIINHFETET